MDFSDLIYWIKERERIRLKRAAGLAPPWTSDPILAAWSFTNCRREDDRVSRWVRVNLREPNLNHPDLFFLMVVACFVNNIETLEELRDCLLPWDEQRFLDVMASRAERDAPLYGGAYRIRPDGRFPSTAEYQSSLVFGPLWRDRERVRPRIGDKLENFASRLGKHHGFGGGFMTAQVVAALKYAPPLNEAADWSSFVISGPGSRRGLARVYGRQPNLDWKSEAMWRAAFNQLRTAIDPHLEAIGLGDLSASDLQNCLCELDKFLRVRGNEGRPRRKFRPSPDPLPGVVAEAAE